MVQVEKELVRLLLVADRKLVDFDGGHGLDLFCSVGAAGLVSIEEGGIEGLGRINTFSGS